MVGRVPSFCTLFSQAIPVVFGQPVVNDHLNAHAMYEAWLLTNSSCRRRAPRDTRKATVWSPTDERSEMF